MVDYAIDDSFDIFFTDYDDIAEVDGLDEFEDDLVTQTHFQFAEILNGAKQSDNLTEKVTLLVKRIAEQFGVIEEIARIDVTRPVDRPETLSISVTYRTGDTFQESL